MILSTLANNATTAIAIARPSGTVGYVDVPHGSSEKFNFGLFANNIALKGGVAPVRAYIRELLKNTVAGKLDASIGFNRRSRRCNRWLCSDGQARVYESSDQTLRLKLTRKKQ